MNNTLQMSKLFT